MPRPIWKGAISFGLVSVPVKLYAATGEHDVKFHQVHREDGGRIRYRRTCSVCGEEVEYADIAKGYEAPDGQLVILTDEDLAELPVASGHEIDVVEFVPSEQIDPILYAKSYYLEAEARGGKPYALLREALSQSDRMAVVKFALRQRESLAVLRVRDDVIVLQTMLWPDEVRDASFVSSDDDIELRPQELQMAQSLIESMASDFDPDEYEDSYAEAVEELVESKLSGGQATEKPAEEEDSGGGEVIDLLTALQRSVDRSRGESAPVTRAPVTKAAAKKAPAKKAAAKEAPAKKAAAKKAPAKKAPAKKSA